MKFKQAQGRPVSPTSEKSGSLNQLLCEMQNWMWTQVIKELHENPNLLETIKPKPVISWVHEVYNHEDKMKSHFLKWISWVWSLSSYSWRWNLERYKGVVTKHLQFFQALSLFGKASCEQQYCFAQEMLLMDWYKKGQFYYLENKYLKIILFFLSLQKSIVLSIPIYKLSSG